jgi:putative tryptophan/tyrosine transport system substrate-binding protein
MFNERARIGSFVLAKGLPAEVAVAEMLPFGPLLSYGQDFPDYFRRAVSYVDRILKGAKPADLPVEQPSRFKLTLNMKTAKSLNLEIPPHSLPVRTRYSTSCLLSVGTQVLDHGVR